MVLKTFWNSFFHIFAAIFSSWSSVFGHFEGLEGVGGSFWTHFESDSKKYENKPKHDAQIAPIWELLGLIFEDFCA